MALYNLNDIRELEIFPGFRGKMVHGDEMTLAYWDIDQGCILPEHAHIHEQSINVLDGTLEINMLGKTYILEKGQVLMIPSNVPHSGKAITFCRVLDVFTPVREDYRR
jgi:quercetin dioxygenase-like cupin family protein